MAAENDQNCFLNLQFLSTSDPINPSSSINPKVALRFPEGHQLGAPHDVHIWSSYVIGSNNEQYMRGCSSDPGRPWVQHVARSKALEMLWTCLDSLVSVSWVHWNCCKILGRCCQGTGDVSDAITWAKKQSDSQRSGPKIRPETLPKLFRNIP